MLPTREILFFISLAGCFNGLILSVYFIFFNKKKNLGNYLFGFLLLMLCIRISKSVVWYFNPDLPIFAVQFGLAVCLLIGPLLFIYLSSSLQSAKKMRLSWKIMLMVCFASIFILLIFFTANHHLILWKKYFVKIIYLQWFFCVLVSGVLLKPVLQKFLKENLKPNEKWLLTVFFSNLLIVVNYIVSLFNIFNLPYIVGAITFSIIFYLNFLIIIHRKKTDDLFGVMPEKYNNRKLDDQRVSTLIMKLNRLFEEERIYENPDLKLVDLASYLSISTHQLSQLLNDNLGKTFPIFLNEYRIGVARKIISSNIDLKLEAVGYEVGYNSKSNFFASFKKITGITPRVYRESLKINE